MAALAATAPDRDGVRWLALDWLTAPVPAALPDPGADLGADPDPVPRAHPTDLPAASEPAPRQDP